ncbi:MAG TPA: amino acid adenylation domain-containing protein, partial [Puia sp.]|nr:amino acid adenylation domain-containing protein [Puia sp.]
DRIRQLIAVKEHLHRVPHKGIGYGILRYLSGRDYQLTPSISFNYLGDFGRGSATGEENSALGVFSGQPHGKNITGDWHREALLDVTGIMVEGRLRLSISYSTQQYTGATIEKLSAAYRRQLEDLITMLSSATEIKLTPVDLTYKGLSVQQWQELNIQGDIEDVYTLSPLQEGLYYQWLMNPRATTYFEQMSYQAKGVLNIPLLEKSYQALVARHRVLRTSFSRRQGPLLQLVRKEVRGEFSYEDKSEAPSFSIAAFREADRARGFDLHSGSQMRLQILKTDRDVYEFVWSHHHILMDGWCVSILIKEFFAIYYNLLEGREPALDKVVPYADYIDWLGHQDRQASLNYWRNYLAGYDTVSVLPKKENTGRKGFKRCTTDFLLEGPLRQSIRLLCAELGVTESTFIQVAWGILLARYNNTTDVVFGAVVSGRPPELKGVEEMIGMFINTIPVRIRTDGPISVRELLISAQQASIQNVAYRYTQLGEIQEETLSGTALFDHIILVENFPIQKLVEQSMPAGLRETALSLLSFEVFGQNNFDLTITVHPGDSIEIRFHYNGNVYETSLIKRLKAHFFHIISQLAQQPSATVKDITCLDKKEKRRLLVSFNKTAPGYTGYRSLLSLFGGQVTRAPGSIAVRHDRHTLSYGELDETSNRLAAYLSGTYGIRPDDRVGIMLDRSPRMIIAILGVLKAGGAYVPIDPTYPKTRRAFILQDAGIGVLLTQTDYLFDLDFYEGAVVALDVQLEGMQDAPASPALNPGEDHLAYVIYTSGSTGKPKGCAITHGNLSNYIQWADSYYFRDNQGANFGLFTSLSFDLTVTSIFCSLTTGGALTLYDQQADLARILTDSFSADSGINSIKLTPSHISYMKHLNLSSSTMVRAIVGGEQVTTEQIDILKKIHPAIEIYNEYGPTETTVGCVVAPLEQHGPVLIGKPIAHTSIYILSQENILCPVGVAGEICIGGSGLAHGYLNNPELTTAKFVPDPFHPGRRMYRTGDLGKWLPDGNLVFIGRRDQQVKIRGYRVETGEIEILLQEFEGVDAALVLTRADKEGDRELIAYVTAKDPLDITELRAWLARQLPVYMLPAHFVQLSQWPLTINGKIDKEKLPAPGGLDTGAGYESPRNELEEQLVAIWQEVLGRDKVGITDNFFDIGGNSIRIVRLSGLVSNLLDKDISAALLFEYPNIKGLLDHVMNDAVPQEQTYGSEELMGELNKFNFEGNG